MSRYWKLTLTHSDSALGVLCITPFPYSTLSTSSLFMQPGGTTRGSLRATLAVLVTDYPSL